MNYPQLTGDQLRNPDNEHKHVNFSVEFLLQVINSIPDPVFVKDTQHCWVFLNNAYCHFMGYSREELLGKSDYDFFPQQEADVFWDMDELVFNTGTPNENEEHFTDACGVQHVISTKKSLFMDETGNKFLVGTIRDITKNVAKYQQVEAELRQGEAKFQLVYAKMETLVKLRTEQLEQMNEALQANISQYQQNEADLSESQEKLHKLAQTVPGMLYEFLLQTDGSMLFTYVSPGSYEIYGIEPEEIEADAQLIISTVHPDEYQEFEQSIVISAQTLQPWRWEGRIVLSSGQVKWIKGASRPELQANGSVLWYGVLLDVTERKLSEEALIRSNAMLQAQQEAALEGILVVDENRTVVSFNQRFAQLWQIPDAVLQTRDQRQLMVSVLDKVENRQDFLSKVEYLYHHRDQTSRDEIAFRDGRILDRYSAPVHSPSGDYYGRIWFFRDITESKRSEAAIRKSEAQLRLQAQQLQQALDQLQRTQIQLVQSEKMSSLGQLVAGIAHEINNPVNFIYGNINHTKQYIQQLLRLIELYEQHYPCPILEIQNYIRVIELDFLKSDLSQILTSMKVGAERIRQIVLSLRTFSRLDEAELKTVDIHEGIESTLMILQNRLNANKTRSAIEVIKEYSNLPRVECYPGQLNQVFLNILTNAIDALEEGVREGVINTPNKDWVLRHEGYPTPSIWICTEVVEPNRVIVRIADNGRGMSQEVKERIFDPFFTTKPVGKGTGLGLSISYQIVTDRHGGSLHCISEPGQGAEFIVSIPLVQESLIPLF